MGFFSHRKPCWITRWKGLTQIFFTFIADTLILPSVWGIIRATSISTHSWFANQDWVGLFLKSVCQSWTWLQFQLWILPLLAVPGMAHPMERLLSESCCVSSSSLLCGHVLLIGLHRTAPACLWMQIVPQYQLLVCTYSPLQAAAVYFVGRNCWHVQNLQAWF